MKVKHIIFLYALQVSTQALGSQEASTPSLSSISKLAISVIEQQITPGNHAKVKIIPQRLDTRLTPPRCFPPIEASIASDREIKRNNTVKITCNSPDLPYPWQIFLSVRVDILYPVVVAKQTLGRGDLITAEDIVIKYVEQTILRGKEFDNIDDVIGTRVKRRMAANQPIFANNLCFVCKGDAVSIYARSANVEINTVGEALRDGNLGDKIPIRNTHSQKNLDARVTGIGEVEVRM